MKAKNQTAALPDPHSSKPGLTRRDLLKGVAGLGAAAALSGCSSETAQHDRGGKGSAALYRPELIRRENERPGTRDWMLQNTRIEPKSKYRCPEIEGYCSRTSVRPGESIGFCVSTNPASAFTL